MMKVMYKYSKDNRCKFDQIKHTYQVRNKFLTGVTTFISKFKTPFNALEVATKYVAKHGGDVKELMGKWKLEGELSCIYGSAVHDVFERYILHNDIVITGKYDKEKQAVKFIEDFFFTRRLRPIETEIIVYDEKAGLASMIDCVVRDMEGLYYILDWKTNKKIEMNGYGKYMAYPFQVFPDSNYYHYQLQLNIYKSMYKDHNINGMYIVHLDTDKYHLINCQNLNLDLNATMGKIHGMGRMA